MLGKYPQVDCIKSYLTRRMRAGKAIRIVGYSVRSKYALERAPDTEKGTQAPQPSYRGGSRRRQAERVAQQSTIQDDPYNMVRPGDWVAEQNGTNGDEHRKAQSRGNRK